MPHKIEPSPSGRAACRGCKQPIEKGTLRFGEEAPNPYSDEGGTSYRYWHLACAAAKLANELRAALATFEGTVPDRAALDALVEAHARPEFPYAERASTGRARCRACDETIKKGELRVAFERLIEGPMGPQRAAAYAHPRCVGKYLEREAEHGREGMGGEKALRAVMEHSKLDGADREILKSEMATATATPTATPTATSRADGDLADRDP